MSMEVGSHFTCPKNCVYRSYLWSLQGHKNVEFLFLGFFKTSKRRKNVGSLMTPPSDYCLSNKRLVIPGIIFFSVSSVLAYYLIKNKIYSYCLSSIFNFLYLNVWSLKIIFFSCDKIDPLYYFFCPFWNKEFFSFLFISFFYLISNF